MAYKTKAIKKYLKERNGVKWNTLYRKFGTKDVNRAIESGQIYSGMDGEARSLQ